MRLEQIIASSCRQKMLLALAKVKETHVTQLVWMINSTYNEVRRNLEILHDEGIVKFTSYGNLKMVELERGNQKTEKLLNALRALQREDAPNPKTDEKLPEPKRANNKR
jgi:DeoR/GlpR family transcriptional regulator of sugar metabolism